MRLSVAAFITIVAPLWSAVQAETFEARLDWATRVAIGIPASGTVQQVTAGVGERVAAGALLLRIDDTRYRHKLRMRESTVARTRSDAEETRRELERQGELYNLGSLSTVDLNLAEQASVRARADHDRALAALEIARYQLGQTRVLAPFDAWVVERRLQAGETVNTAQQAVTAYVLAPVDRYTAVAQVPVAIMVNLMPEAKAFVEIAAKRYPGVLRIERFPEIAPGSPASYTIGVRFEAPGSRLLPGTPARIILP